MWCLICSFDLLHPAVGLSSVHNTTAIHPTRQNYKERVTAVQTWSMYGTCNYGTVPDTKLPTSLKKIPYFFLLNSVRVWLHLTRVPPAKASWNVLVCLQVAWANPLPPAEWTSLKTRIVPPRTETPNLGPQKNPAAAQVPVRLTEQFPQYLQLRTLPPSWQSPQTGTLLLPP